MNKPYAYSFFIHIRWIHDLGTTQSKPVTKAYLQMSWQLLQTLPPEQSKAPSSPAVEWCLLRETFNHNNELVLWMSRRKKICKDNYWVPVSKFWGAWCCTVRDTRNRGGRQWRGGYRCFGKACLINIENINLRLLSGL